MTKYPNQVTWHRRVSHGDLATHYRNASVFVLPSLYEGHPKTLLEAMSCGCAVLAADSPGIREVIRHGETGWLCGVDAMSIRAALAHLMSDAGLRMRLGQNARAFAVANFALDKIVDMELGVYAATLAAEVNLNGMPGAN
jgi:glycosyltransferase involved in cell wall biosynthesis